MRFSSLSGTTPRGPRFEVTNFCWFGISLLAETATEERERRALLAKGFFLLLILD
jgi:hypothetical protein